LAITPGVREVQSSTQGPPITTPEELFQFESQLKQKEANLFLREQELKLREEALLVNTKKAKIELHLENDKRMGFLFKRPINSEGKAWRKRWFVLDGIRLQYFKTRTDTKPAGYINLVDILNIETGSSKPEQRKFVFILFSRAKVEKPLKFYSTNIDDRTAWIVAIKEAIHKINNAPAITGHDTDSEDELAQLNSNEDSDDDFISQEVLLSSEFSSFSFFISYFIFHISFHFSSKIHSSPLFKENKMIEVLRQSLPVSLSKFFYRLFSNQSHSFTNSYYRVLGYPGILFFFN
jgi:hypothetical protein